MKNEIQFDMEAAIQALRQGKGLSGKDAPPDQAADRSGNEGGAGRPRE